jgi:hypothetical protein
MRKIGLGPEAFERHEDRTDVWYVSLLDGRSEWHLPPGAILTSCDECEE